MAKPTYTEAFYESHFVRDPFSNEIMYLIFGKVRYKAAGEPNTKKPSQEKLDGSKLEAEVKDKEALRLIARVPLNGQLPIVEYKQKEAMGAKFYRFEVPAEKLGEREKVYAKLDFLGPDLPWLEIYAGGFDRTKIQFPGYFWPGETLLFPGRPSYIDIPTSVHDAHQAFAKTNELKK